MSVKVTGVSKRIGDKWVLRDISFDVAQAEMFGVYGPSGAGKSTLLRMIAGLETSNGGSITRRVNPTLFPSPEKAGLSTLFRPKDPQPTKTLLEDLSAALDSCEGLLLLDEVFSSLDERECDEAVGLIKEAWTRKRPLSVVIASARFDDIMRVNCQSVAVINNSYVRQIGAPITVYEEPESVDVAALVGRCNLIEARRLTSTKKDVPVFQTIVGGHRLVARKTEKRELGSINQNVHLAIRPEQISISFGASFPEDNLLRATITEILFHGPVTYVYLVAEGLELSAMVPKIVGLDIGDECMIALPPDRLIVLKG